jgi:hypothetical protein
MAALVAAITVSAPALAVCGHDVNGRPDFFVTDLGNGDQIMHYFSPATLIADDPSDARHRIFGECRGMGIVRDGVQTWQGGCYWEDADGDRLIGHWASNPGDTGTEDRDALHGTVQFMGTGKFAETNATGRWTGLANGGSYWCED